MSRTTDDDAIGIVYRDADHDVLRVEVSDAADGNPKVAERKVQRDPARVVSCDDNPGVSVELLHPRDDDLTVVVDGNCRPFFRERGQHSARAVTAERRVNHSGCRVGLDQRHGD